MLLDCMIKTSTKKKAMTPFSGMHS